MGDKKLLAAIFTAIGKKETRGILSREVLQMYLEKDTKFLMKICTGNADSQELRYEDLARTLDQKKQNESVTTLFDLFNVKNDSKDDKDRNIQSKQVKEEPNPP